MKIVSAIAELPHPSDATVGLVPTMGAFHEGHLGLMRFARAQNDLLVASLFVNPTQFGEGEDLSRYPRDLDRDARLAETVGVDILFAPSVAEVYPGKPVTSVHVADVALLWEGSHRPGHFDGVATVVAKLLNMVRPNAAYFGQKDLQQTVVVRRMTADLNMPVRIEVLPTSREADGLAMSSRNVFLSTEERRVAPQLFHQLTQCASILKRQDRTDIEADEALAMSRNSLRASGFVVDYFEWVDADTLNPIRGIAPTGSSDGSALIAAARLGRTRLIDNVLL